MTTRITQNALVVGVDGSKEAWQALAWAADRAAEQAGQLHITHAGDTRHHHHEDASGKPGSYSLCEEALTRVSQDHPALEVACSEPVGPPIEALIEASTKAGALVLGTRGLGAVRGAVLGSVASRVSAAASCPVVVVREHATADPQGPVVVGVDARPDGEAALEFAFAEAERRGRTLVAVHCWQLDPAAYAGGIPMPGADLGTADREHRDLLEHALLAPSKRHPDVRVEQHVDRIATVDSLVQRGAKASMVVVGTRGHLEIGGLVLGSVSQGLMRRAHCPVVVVSRAAYGRPSDSDREVSASA